MDEPKETNSLRKFIKFGIVGFTGFLVNSAFLELFSGAPFLASFLEFLAHRGVAPFLLNQSAWAAGLAAELAIISNFVLNNVWTFRAQQIAVGSAFFLKFLQFNAVSCGAIVIQSVVVGGATHYFGQSLVVRQLSLIGAIAFLVVPYNWLMYNKIVWKKANREKQ